MTIFFDIQAALDSRLNDLQDLPDVAWENINYEPVPGTTFIRPTNLQGFTEQLTLGDNGQDQTDGIYQIDIFTDANTGKAAGLRLVDIIADQFKRGTDLTYNSTTVRVQNVSRGTALNSDGWYQVPVLINYYAITAARS